MKNADGTITVKKPEEIKVGDIIVVKPGEKIPLDGIVLSGRGDIDTAALQAKVLLDLLIRIWR